jgi:ubiquinone/menaquinone biosynthesis C-methylase UbiE
MSSDAWKQSLERFFYDRGAAISGVPTLLDHCMVSAKDPRLATRPDFYADLIGSLVAQMRLEGNADVLEVGCASGYIAFGLAPKVGRYSGIDLAAMPIHVARKMDLPNADFRQADGAELPFEEGRFDAAFACDVFSNFPSFAEAEPLLREMVRVVRPGGRVLAASITDASRAEEFQQHVYDVAARLEAEYGPPPAAPERKPGLLEGLANRLKGVPAPPAAEAQIVNFNFEKSDFEAFGRARGLEVEIHDVHALNPYRGFRYNVVFTRPPV